MALPGTKGRHRVYLMRHGEVRYFDAGGMPVDPKTVALTEAGRGQARAAGMALADIPLDRVVTSTLPRAQETARLVLGHRALPIDARDGLREIRGGRFSDIPPERREAELVYGFEAATEPGASFAGGETYVDFQARVVGAFLEILAEPGWTRALVVAHDGVNRMLLSWASHAGLAGIGSFEQDMGCINIIDVDLAEGAVVRSLVKAVNLTPYDLAKSRLHLTSMEQVLAQSR